MAPKKGDLSEDEQTLYKHIQNGDTTNVKLLLNSKNVRIDCLDEHGMTPLQHAAYRGNYDLCKIFLDRGADVNSNFHDSGYTALMFSGLAGKLDVVSLLLEQGASTTAVNSVGRTASQMAAFVGNHDVVSIINNFIPKEEVDYYTVIHGLESEPKLASHLALPLYKLLLKTNIHPVRIALYLESHPTLLESANSVIKVLQLMCEKQMKSSDPNEVLSLKFHHLAFVVKSCNKFLKDSKEPKQGDGKDLLHPLIKIWIKGREEDGFPLTLEKFLRQSVREFPFHECSILQQLVHTLSGVEIGNEPSAISILSQAITGQKGYEDVPVCATCSEPKAEKRCSACKSVQYCDQECQKLHWFTHKKQCPKLSKKYQLEKEREAAEAAAAEEAKKQQQAAEENENLKNEEKSDGVKAGDATGGNKENQEDAGDQTDKEETKQLQNILNESKNNNVTAE